MPITELGCLPRSPAALAAIVGATRAMEMAFPIMTDEVVLDRLDRAIAALFEAEPILALRDVAEAA